MEMSTSVFRYRLVVYRFICLTLLLLLFSSSPKAFAQWEAFDALIEEELAKGEVPGIKCGRSKGRERCCT